MPSKPASSPAAQLPEAASGVKLIVFDVFGTVVDWRSGIIEEGLALNAKYALDVDWADFADQWVDRYQPSMERVRSGEIPWTKLNVLFRRSLDETLASNRIRGLSEDDKEHFSRVWYRLKPWPDSLGGLRRIKARFIIAPLSNGNLSMLTEMAKRSGLPWDCILSAELARKYKPAPEAYLSAPAFFDLEPEQVMMVAAHNMDLVVPRKLGMKTAFLYRDKGLDSAQGPYDFVVEDIEELAARLGL